jgi:hypothetical protein
VKIALRQSSKPGSATKKEKTEDKGQEAALPSGS